MFRFSSPFVLDLRSIALFRIAFGSIMLFDIFSRLPYVGLFLSDDGALSRADLLEISNRPWAFSLYMMFGESSQVTTLLLLNAVAALLLIVGLWTRVVSIVCWVMLLSLLHRNPLVLNGGDTLFSVYAFWMMFLPLNARWSIDRLLKRSDKVEVEWEAGNNYLGMPGIAIMLQTVFVYVFTVILKTGELWATGDVVHYVVRNQGLIKTPAIWFQQFDSWHLLLSKATYHWEWLGCVLLLCPFANPLTRSFAIVGYIGLHTAFGLMLDLSIFAPASILGWLVVIPAFWWEGWNRIRCPMALQKIGHFSERFLVRSLFGKGGGLILPSRFKTVATGAALLMVFVWNLRGLPDSPVKDYIPEPVEKAMYVVKLRQKWAMFAPNPSRDSYWFALEAQLVNGDSVDLFLPDSLFSLRRPEVFTERLPDRRWGKFMSNLKKGRNARLRNDYIEYFVDRWNNSVGASSKIEKASLLYIRERIGEDGKYYDREVRNLRVVHIEGVAQIVDESDNSEAETDSDEDL